MSNTFLYACGSHACRSYFISVCISIFVIIFKFSNKFLSLHCISSSLSHFDGHDLVTLVHQWHFFLANGHNLFGVGCFSVIYTGPRKDQRVVYFPWTWTACGLSASNQTPSSSAPSTHLPSIIRTIAFSTQTKQSSPLSPCILMAQIRSTCEHTLRTGTSRGSLVWPITVQTTHSTGPTERSL